MVIEAENNKNGIFDVPNYKNLYRGTVPEEVKPDIINQAPHYTHAEIEPIDYMEGLGILEDGCVFNIIKYVSRYKHKNGVEDLKKAQYYMNKLVTYMEAGDAENDS